MVHTHNACPPAVPTWRGLTSAPGRGLPGLYHGRSALQSLLWVALPANEEEDLRTFPGADGIKEKPIRMAAYLLRARASSMTEHEELGRCGFWASGHPLAALLVLTASLRLYAWLGGRVATNLYVRCLQPPLVWRGHAPSCSVHPVPPGQMRWKAGGDGIGSDPPTPGQQHDGGTKKNYIGNINSSSVVTINSSNIGWAFTMCCMTSREHGQRPQILVIQRTFSSFF